MSCDLKRFHARIRRMHTLVVRQIARPRVPAGTKAALHELAGDLLALSHQVEEAIARAGGAAVDAKTRKSLVAAGIELVKKMVGLS